MEKSKKSLIIIIVSVVVAAALIATGILVLPGIISKDNTDVNANENNTNVNSNQDDFNNISVVPNTNSNSSDNKLPTESNSNVSSTEKTEDIKITKVYNFKLDWKTPEFEKKVFNDTKNGNTLPYRFVAPKNYSASKKYPVVLFLHGAGEMGTDNEKHINNAKKMFEYNGDFLSQAFVICPQTNEWWDVDRNASGDKKGMLGSVLNLLDELSKNYSFDSDRIYVTGLSMGGYATWNLLQQYGDIFAAGMPICGGGNANMANKLIQIPIRIYHSADDPTVSVTQSRNMYNAIVASGGKKAKYIELDGLGHNCWDYAFSDRDAFCWMFAQNKAKNSTGAYQFTPYFRVVDSNGNNIITDSDVEMLYYGSGYEGDKYVVTFNITLTNNGQTKINNAYKAAKSKEFTVYWCDQKLYSYSTNVLIDNNTFIIEGIFDESSASIFYKTVKMSCDIAKDRK